MKARVTATESFDDIIKMTQGIESMWTLYPGAVFKIETVERWNYRKDRYEFQYDVKITWEEER